MRVLTGPAGSGKTASVLEEFRGALRARRDDVRLLVPTATMAEHLQNRLAREGFVFRRSLVQTLSGFVEARTRDLRQVPETVLYLIVEEAARRVDRPEFARVVSLPGFCASLSRTIAEFSSAGCDSARLAVVPARCAARGGVPGGLPGGRSGTGPARAGAAWSRGWRSRRSGSSVKASTESRPFGWMGSTRSPTRNCGSSPPWPVMPDVTLAIQEERFRRPGSRARDQRRASQPSRGRRPRSASCELRASSANAKRSRAAFWSRAAAGRPFREIGIIVRAAEMLRARFWGRRSSASGSRRDSISTPKLERHPAVRLLAGAVDAMLGGWDHGATLAALRLAPGLRSSPARSTGSISSARADPECRAGRPAGADAGSRLLSAIDAAGGHRGVARHRTRRRRDWTARVNAGRDRRCSTEALDGSRRGARMPRRDRVSRLLARGESRAAAEAATSRRSTPQRGECAERARSAAVGAAGRVCVRHGREAVPAIPPAGPVLPRCGAPRC